MRTPTLTFDFPLILNGLYVASLPVCVVLTPAGRPEQIWIEGHRATANGIKWANALTRGMIYGDARCPLQQWAWRAISDHLETRMRAEVRAALSQSQTAEVAA